jgi:GntR family transcriptional regulator
MSEQMNIRAAEDLIELEIDHSSPVPLHKQVEMLLRELIKSTEYQSGKLLPKEVDLAKRLGISRNTVRQATNKLVHENLLIRKKGVGTRVAPKQVTTHLDHWFSFSQEMHDQGRALVNYRVDVGWVKADKHIAAQLEIKPGKKILKLERLRGQGDGPFVQFISYFHPRVGLTGQEDFAKHLYEILEQKYATVPMTSQEKIQALPADAEIAERLGISEGEPVLFRERKVSDPGNRPIEYNIGYYRGDKFTYAIDIKRQST